MAYSGKIKGIPSEMASKIGHLSIIEDAFVKELLQSFQSVPKKDSMLSINDLSNVELSKPAKKIICIDGSFTVVPHALQDHKKLAYIKIAALGLDLDDLKKANKSVVNPEILSKITSEYATTQSTVIPLSNVVLEGKSLRETLRSAIFLSFKKLFEGRLLDTLVFLTSRLWSKSEVLDAHFSCINCSEEVAIERGKSEFKCPHCSEDLTIVDYLGFLSQIPEDGAEDKVATDLMLMLEHLTLIYYLRELLESGQDSNEYLFMKDGPLLLSGQYSRLVDPIRSYFSYLKKIKKEFNLVGIEKNGVFVSHIPEIINSFKDDKSVFIPSNDYIFKHIKLTSSDNTKYGERVLYGSKLFYCPDQKNVFVLTIPVGEFILNPKVENFYNLSTILASIKELQSYRYENGLAPIAAVNSIASMSFYPSNNILSRFANDMINKDNK